MKPDAETQLRTLLMPGERLLWSGRPAGGLRFEMDDIFLTLFFLAWTAFSTMALFSDGIDGAGVLIPVGFVALGIYMLVLRYPIDARKRSRTLYGMTDRRAILLENFPRERVRSIPLDSVEDVELKLYGDGTGSIIGRSDVRDWPCRDEDGDPVKGPLFRYVSSPQVVYAMVIEVRAALMSQLDRAGLAGFSTGYRSSREPDIRFDHTGYGKPESLGS